MTKPTQPSFTGYYWGRPTSIVMPDRGYITVVPHYKEGIVDDIVLTHIATTSGAEDIAAAIRALKDE